MEKSAKYKDGVFGGTLEEFLQSREWAVCAGNVPSGDDSKSRTTAVYHQEAAIKFPSLERAENARKVVHWGGAIKHKKQKSSANK